MATKNIGTPLLTKLVLAVFFVAALLFLIFSSLYISTLKKAAAVKQGELDVYKNEGIGSLSRQRVSLEKQQKAIESSYNEIITALSSDPKSKMLKDPGDSLKFKEELHKIQNKLREDGASINFQFPFWLGFDRYEHDIPTAMDLPIRVKQLDIVKELSNLMLKASVPEITLIEFGPVRDIFAEGDKTPLYKEFIVKTAFKCKNENLIKYLHYLSISDIPFKADSIKVKVSGEEGETKGDLTVELTIMGAIFI